MPMDIPQIDLELLEYLDAKFPEVSSSPLTPYQELTYRIGQRSIVQFLKMQYNEQHTNNPYIEPPPNQTNKIVESSSFDNIAQEIIRDCTRQIS